MVEVWWKRDSYQLGLMDAHLNESCEKKAFNFGYLDIQAQATAIHPAIPWTPVTLFSLFKPYRLDDSHGVIPSGCRRRECADYVVDIYVTIAPELESNQPCCLSLFHSSLSPLY